MEGKYDYSDNVISQLGDAVVWTAILAAVHQDGVIHEEERAAAIKQAHIRTFSSEEYLQPIYEKLDLHFESDFDRYTAMLPEEYANKEAFIQKKLEEYMDILNEVGPVFTTEFSKSLESFYDKVFNANSTVFQSFAFPLLSAHLDRHKRG